MSIKLTENQTALLQNAARREDRCFVLPPNLKGAAAQKVATKLIAEGLALLWQFRFAGFGEEFFAVRTSPGRRSYEEFEDGLPDGRHARFWRRSADSLFSVPLV
jgi:hypothetical protein